MSESSFETVLDVLAREIDSLRYQLKLEGEHNEKLSYQVCKLEDENSNLRAMIEGRCENHE